MDDSEIEARFGALRTALALAISVGRNPSEMQHLRAALRDIIAFVPAEAHPATRDELERIVSTFVRLPTQHASADQGQHHPSAAPSAPALDTTVRSSRSLDDEATLAKLL